VPKGRDTDDPSGSITSQTTRGFTGHEMIDEVVRRAKRFAGAFRPPAADRASPST